MCGSESEKIQKHVEGAQKHKIAMRFLVPSTHSKVICKTFRLNDFWFGLRERKQMKKTKEISDYPSGKNIEYTFISPDLVS